jgi:hypothetical protein
MSTSRSVAAAQRRRAGPPEPQQIRGPNTSINSSQVFSQQQQQPQLRPGTTGRLAGQQASLQQQQFQQQQQQQQQQPNLKQDINQQGSKMTLPQAITLITLRLGRLETQVSQLDNTSLVNENGEIVDSQLIDSILERLDFLEQEKLTNENINNNQDIKQQLEVIKTTVNTLRNTCTLNNKEIKLFKNEIQTLKTELLNTKYIVEELQYKTNFSENMDIEENNNIINNLTSNSNEANSEELNIELGLKLELESTLNYEPDINENIEPSFDNNADINSDLNLNLGTESLINNSTESNDNENISLKEIIQQELKQSGISIISNNPQVNNKKSGKSQKSSK